MFGDLSGNFGSVCATAFILTRTLAIGTPVPAATSTAATLLARFAVFIGGAFFIRFARLFVVGAIIVIRTGFAVPALFVFRAFAATATPAAAAAFLVRTIFVATFFVAAIFVAFIRVVVIVVGIGIELFIVLVLDR